MSKSRFSNIKVANGAYNKKKILNNRKNNTNFKHRDTDWRGRKYKYTYEQFTKKPIILRKKLLSFNSRVKKRLMSNFYLINLIKKLSLTKYPRLGKSIRTLKYFKKLRKKTAKIAYYRSLKLVSKVNKNRKTYYAFLKRKGYNIFITITDKEGNVVISKSAGSCKIKSKKKKRSWDTLKDIARLVAKVATMKNIRYIKKFFTTLKYMKNAKIVSKTFRMSRLSVVQTEYIINQPHAIPLRKKKAKRL